MPSFLVQIAFLIIFVWSIVMLVQDLKVSHKRWMNVLLHASVAVVSLNFFLVF
ncbi:hypothetical protein [Paenibacillus sp. PL91]|jgi:hypothetical protein|uniref:hypothetical protein n=1 Tax=Paenibacillus sp. PL91 TaxID=2729538 RepID=UPI00145CD963|nr:hypothetical protein [Paenibacillus sp. PL91]MBC9202498.1 hypothetical protein [Paenibacillus sp. PL91]